MNIHSFARRVVSRKALFLQAAVLCVCSTGAFSAVIDSPIPASTPVPANTSGVYINVVTGATGAAAAFVPGWDVNPWGSTGLSFFAASPSASHGSVTTGGAILPLAIGSTVSAASTFGTPSPTNGVGFRSTQDGYMGFRFVNENTGVVNYGYMRITTTGPSGHPAVVLCARYENTGAAITVAACPSVDLAVTLTDTPDPANAGGTVTYVATATNNGPGSADAVSLTVTIPAGTTLGTITPSAGGTCNAVSPVVCSWAGATASGAARAVTVLANVPASTASATVLNAIASAATTTPDPTSGNNSTATSTTVSASADLSLALSDTPDPVTAGTNLTYVATATNAGPSDAQNVAINLPLPASTTLVSATASGGTCAATNCTFSGATVPGASRSVTYVVTVAPSAPGGGTLSATATANSDTTDPNTANSSATTTTVVVASADLSIALNDSPDPATAGTNLAYVATATNAGPSDAQNVAINLPLPANTTLVSATAAGGTCAGTNCTFAGATAPGASRSVTYVVLVAASAANGSSIWATAAASSATTDPNTANNSATATTAVVAVADLSVALTASAAQTLINLPVTFTATSTNGGPSDAQNVSVTITLTPDFRYSGHTATGATCTTPQIGNTGAIVCTWAGATAAGATRTLSVVAFSNVEGNTAVNASTTSATTDPVANNNATGVSVVVGYPFTEIPTLSQFGLMLLGLLVALMGFVAVRRQG